MSSNSLKKLECDYLVIGGGATGMAFVDEMIHNSRNLKVVLVDKHAKPGGHWNDAYPFVRLHAPAAWYGVNSRVLGRGGADLATKAQILAYYELVMEDLKSTGRLSYFPQCEYLGGGKFKSLLQEGLEYEVNVLRKTVDATLLLTHVPATKPPEYAIEDGVNLVPINKLAEIKKPWNKYVVIGAGKTGIDALLHLLDHNVDQNKLTWIVPNDSWFFNRDPLAGENIKDFTKTLPSIFAAFLKSEDVNDAYKRFEEVGQFMRLDKNIWPTKMRAATVSSKEMHQLQTIVNVVRLGRIERITNNSIVFKQGESIPTDADTLHIDCSASGTNFPPVKEKLFDGKNIYLQMVQVPQPCTTGAMIAALEIKYPEDEDRKNLACTPINAPQLPAQWFELQYLNNLNADRIGKELGIRWMRKSRLSVLHHISVIPCIQLMAFMIKNKDQISEKNKLFGEQTDMYGKFDTNHK